VTSLKTQHLNNDVLSPLHNVVYTTGIPARIGGFSQLTLEDGYTLLADGVASVTRFKNVLAFGVQSIVIAACSRALLAFYMKAIRPIAVKRGGDATRVLNSRKSPLWISFDGVRIKEAKLGYYLTRFFEEQCNLHMSSDTLRSLLETFTHQQQLKGHLSVEQKSAVTETNNHSSETTKRYYLIHEKNKVARLGANAVQEGLPAPLNKEVAREEDRVRTPTISAASDIGSHHSALSNAPRAKWDEEELCYLARCINEVRAGYEKKGTVNPALMKDCLKVILNDEAARRIFHARHVLGSARLRAGFQALVKAGTVSA
jgi:hypothetical protein